MKKLCLICLLILTNACAAPSIARFDYTGGGQVVWPGPPEKPRIKYLYSLSRLSGSEESELEKAAEGIFGEEDVEAARSPRLLRPYGVWVSGGKLYVTDTAATRLTMIDLGSGLVSQLGLDEPAVLQSPIGVIADPGGKIWVTDSLAGLIWIFDPGGKKPPQSLGEKEGMERPTGIALHKAQSRVYVADTAEHCILAYDLTGKFLFKFGQRGQQEGEFNFPTHLAVDKAGNLLVVDSINFRVQSFDPGGKFLSSWGSMGKGWGALSRPKGIAVDSKGHIYLVEADLDGVQIFDGQGRLLLNFGDAGEAIGQFWLPAGIAVDEQDRIYVADTYNGRIQVFQYLEEK